MKKSNRRRTMERKKVIIGWQAPDRKTLQVGTLSIKRPFLRVVLPCGNLREYLTKEDIPERSLQCNCGEVDYEHWFIRYTEKEENNGTETE
jgi:hypothetical protein